MFESISKIRSAVKETPTYEYFPYTYYISRTGDIQHTPTENTIEVNAWLVELGDTGVAVYSVGNGVYVRGYRLDGGIVVEDDEVVDDVIDRIVRVLNGDSDADYGAIKFNKHTATGISVLLGVDYEYVRHAISEAVMRQILEDKVVAIFGDDVIVLSKRRFMYKYSGKDAVNVAKKYAFVVESPISEISEFVVKQLGKNVTFFIFENGSILCSESMCREAPLSPNISRLVSNKLNSFVSVDLTSDDPEKYRNVQLHLPFTATAVAIGKRILYYLDSENNITSHMHTSITHRFPFLIVFSYKGFLGYGVLNKNKVKIFEAEEKEEGGEEEENYLEETVLVS